MSKKTRIGIAFLSVLLILFIAAFASASTAEAGGSPPWTGDPDPYDCNGFQDCYWTMIVCIDGVTHEVGIYYDPALKTNEFMEADALVWSANTVLTVGICRFSR